MLFVLALGVILLVIQPFPVLHDYPEWMYQGHIVYSLLSGENPSLNMLYEWVPVPVPNTISQLVIGLLNFTVSPVMAGQIWLAVYLLLAIVSGYLASKDHVHAGSVFWLFTVTIAFGPGFWNGYINFQFGLLLFALFVAVGLRRSLAWVFVFSVLIYFSHASVFAGFVCFVVLAELFNQRRLTTLLALLPGLVLLLWYTMTRFAEGTGKNVALESVSQWIQYKFYTLAKLGPFHNFIRPDGESLLASVHGLYMAGFAVNFVIAMLVGVWLLFIAWQMIRRTDSRLHYSLLFTAIVLMLAWLLAGKNSFGVVNLGERFLIVAMMLLIMQIQCPDWIRKSWVALTAVVGVVTLVTLVVLSGYSDKNYTVARSAATTELESYVDDIYQNSRHKYFNHRLTIYASLGQYLATPEAFDKPPLIDHESSIVRIRKP